MTAMRLWTLAGVSRAEFLLTFAVSFRGPKLNNKRLCSTFENLIQIRIIYRHVFEVDRPN